MQLNLPILHLLEDKKNILIAGAGVVLMFTLVCPSFSHCAKWVKMYISPIIALVNFL